MVKQAKTVTLDEEVISFIEKDAKEQHLEFSSRLNQILHECIKARKERLDKVNRIN